jgi:hypothetical protein
VTFPAVVCRCASCGTGAEINRPENWKKQRRRKEMFVERGGEGAEHIQQRQSGNCISGSIHQLPVVTKSKQFDWRSTQDVGEEGREEGGSKEGPEDCRGQDLRHEEQEQE